MPHHRSSSQRHFSREDSRSRTHKSSRQHYKLTQRSYSSSQTTPWKHKDRRHKQVTIDDPPSEYYSSDEKDSDLEEKLNGPSPNSHTWGGLPNKDTITIAHITDCLTITVHTGKCYQALIDSGVPITLLQYSTYKKIEDCYKTSTTYHS